MKYNLDKEQDLIAAFDYLAKLAEGKKVVEITRKDPNRSLPQNAYLHLIVGAFGSHFGYTLDEAKEIYKEVNHDLYLYEKKGRAFKKSSRDLTTAEMSKSIDRFREKSAEQGYELPLATDKEWLMQIENQIEQAKHYL